MVNIILKGVIMKKFIALVLSLIMTFAVASPAYAISNGYAFVETSVLANCDVQEKMEDILCAVEPQKALFGLSDINFENVQLGEEIQICKSFFSKVLKLLAFQGVWMFLYSQFPLFFPLSGKNKGKSYCTLSSSFAASRLASLLACA